MNLSRVTTAVSGGERAPPGAVPGAPLQRQLNNGQFLIV